MSEDSSVLDKIQGKMRERFGMRDSEKCCDFEIEERPPSEASEDTEAETEDE